MKIFTHFFDEVKKFTIANWWVYIIYLIMLYAILLHDKNYLLSVTIITSIHFIADIFIMMMFSAYSRNDFRWGTYFQIFSLILFLSLKIYTGLIGDGWHYLAADPIYVLAAIKNYRIDVKNKDLELVTLKTTSILSMATVLIILLPLKIFFHVHIFNNVAQMIQSFGIFLFAIALSTTGNEKLRYKLSIIALSAMVGGSIWETVNSFNSGKMVGLAISYMLLPLTVLVFYLKSWSIIMKKEMGNYCSDNAAIHMG